MYTFLVVLTCLIPYQKNLYKLLSYKSCCGHGIFLSQEIPKETTTTKEQALFIFIFSIYSPYSQMTSLCQVDTKLTNTMTYNECIEIYILNIVEQMFLWCEYASF